MLNAALRATGAALLALAPAAVAAPVAAQPIGGVRDIDWREAGFEVPPVGPCPQQHVRFHDGSGTADGWAYRVAPEDGLGHADVNGDGVEDALLLVDCGPPNSEYSRSLVALTSSGDGAAAPLGTVVAPGNWQQVPVDFTARDGDVLVALVDRETGRRWEELHRWNPVEHAFARVGT